MKRLLFAIYFAQKAQDQNSIPHWGQNFIKDKHANQAHLSYITTLSVFQNVVQYKEFLSVKRQSHKTDFSVLYMMESYRPVIFLRLLFFYT